MILSKPFITLFGLVSTATYISSVSAFPAYASLAGLSARQLAEVVPGLPDVLPGTPPGPLEFSGTKLIYDEAHPFVAPGNEDMRGPCPGLNTLANHGYLPHNGVATPAQIINAVQEGKYFDPRVQGPATNTKNHLGFNMHNELSRFLTYAAFLVDGNLVTDLLSIGGKTSLTGPELPEPAIVGGLSTHAVFEGDASMTRDDAFFGDNHSFNQTRWEKFVDFTERFGNGFYNKTVATELRWELIQQSIATNPQFDFASPRYFTAYAESAFPFTFFTDGRVPLQADGNYVGVPIANASLFFKDGMFPEAFHRAAEPSSPTAISDMYEAHPIQPGRNMGTVNSYTVDSTSADFSDYCLLYTNFVNNTIRSLYPSPEGVLRRNLIINLQYWYETVRDRGCVEQRPYGTVKERDYAEQCKRRLCGNTENVEDSETSNTLLPHLKSNSRTSSLEREDCSPPAMNLSNSFLSLFAALSLLTQLATTVAFPSYGSLAGLSEREASEIVAGLPHVTPPTPPGPLKFNGTKLVYDRAHPWQPLRKGDIRGPCPGLNTLASHGYLPRDGVATPSQIITAVQEGFNFDNALAVFTTYAAHLVDGNLVTDLLSIGGKTPKTGKDAPPPAIIGGLNTHSVFEGDSSMTRGDDFFGDNHSFNQTLFDQASFIHIEEISDIMTKHPIPVQLRRRRIEQSIATNPKFDFTSPRFFTAFAESTFPYTFFVDGRITNRTTAALDMTNATLFFRDSKFPKDFWRAPEPLGPIGIIDIFLAYPIAAGRNVNGTNTFTPDPDSADFNSFCKLYTDFVNKTVKSLYPNPTGILRRNLIINLRYFYSGIATAGCEEQFPYGQL
ncbi:heme-thiolate peroxidase [Coprinellus aureogranulatus]|nr:heme-thiolate peroxidase [Coprinellus aureogranulatus]